MNDVKGGEIERFEAVRLVRALFFKENLHLWLITRPNKKELLYLNVHLVVI